MKSFFHAVAFATTILSVSCTAVASDFTAISHRVVETDNWGNALAAYRNVTTIRASKDDKDDISDDFLAAIKAANNGGLVHLKEGEKYVIGKKLDLTFLNDIYVQIDGELKVTNSSPVEMASY